MLAAGSWSSLLEPVPGAVNLPVRAVYGEIIRLAERTPGHTPVVLTVRALVRGRPVYTSPASRRDRHRCYQPRARLHDRRDRQPGLTSCCATRSAVVPALAEAEFVEAIAGLRPGVPDNLPMIGPSGVDGLIVATGHYRHGILYAHLRRRHRGAGSGWGSDGSRGPAGGHRRVRVRPAWPRSLMDPPQQARSIHQRRRFGGRE